MYRVVLVTTKDHIYSNIIIRKLTSLENVKIVGIIEGVSTLNKKTPVAALKYYLRVSGFRYVFLQLIKMLIYLLMKRYALILGLKDSIYYPHELKNNRKIVAKVVKDINSRLIINEIAVLKPDFILSIFTGLILKDEVLNIPSKGCINIHPSLLPDYRGVSPIFWAMCNNEERNIGVTMHYMTEEIDSGRIISQKRIKTPEYITEHSLYIGVVSVAFYLIKIYFNSFGSMDVDNDNEADLRPSRYFSFPSRESVSRFLMNKKRFYTIKELLFPTVTYNNLFNK